MKTIGRRLTFAAAWLSLALGGAACGNSGITEAQEPERGEAIRTEDGIVIRGTADEETGPEMLVISDADLKSYDWTTAELRFCSQEAADGLEACDRVTFARDGQPLFAVAVVTERSAAAAGTLYVEFGKGYNRSYYLYGDAASAGWQTFLTCLSETGRLVCTQPEPEPEPGTPAEPEPYVPQSPVVVDSGLELVRIAPEAAWCTGSMPENRLAVIRSDAAWSAWLGLPGATTSIDYARHTLLAVRIYTPNLIERITCALNPEGEGYRYSLRVRMNCCTAIGDELLLMLAPALPDGVPVELDFAYDTDLE